MGHDDPFAGKTIEADRSYFLDTSGTYEPALTAGTTDPNLGADGAATGSWHRSGHLITGWAQFLFSGAGVDAGSGVYRIGVPFEFDSSLIILSGATAEGSLLGSTLMEDQSTGSERIGVAQAFLVSPSRLFIQIEGGGLVGSGAPWGWADGDTLSVNFSYVADSAGLPT